MLGKRSGPGSALAFFRYLSAHDGFPRPPTDWEERAMIAFLGLGKD